jgi:hypothetical protein
LILECLRKVRFYPHFWAGGGDTNGDTKAEVSVPSAFLDGSADTPSTR